ncbi:uncharacterized protein N7443_004641 [Penicillium atrosanguineum]|uniref:uncharacterized protein n=1 Tax=Penicillium atrosanguineum TaxID=1132637 RepID=UPI00239DB760|nr:uncharacterized protein N7443_004641 [Penicillium atrosanguineum]KAJ5304981.1 hypothetical protein N7443_004641 [Penicillium atrosanguineum]
MSVENTHGTRPGRFFDSENLKRHNYTCDSSLQSPSTDIPSSSESGAIFNAIRVTTPEGSTRLPRSAYNMGPIMEEGLAANIAMFIPTALDGHQSSERLPHNERRQVDTIWWRKQMLSDQSPHQTPHLGAGPFTETILATGTTRNLHQKALSLDTAEGKQHVPRWPANLGAAVSTVWPQYPPPERQPTPPGLPSFNTPEAVYCSAHFLVGDNGRRHSCGTQGNGQQTHSYGDALLRFFGLSPSTEIAPGGLSMTGIGRADDGTIVQGRFPYRQSGHGINLNRQLNDHPFHQGNLPIAENEAEELRHEGGIDGTCTKDPGTRSRRRIGIYTPLSIGRLSPFSGDTSDSAMLPRPRNQGRAIALLGLRRSSTIQNGATAAPLAVASSVQGVGVIGDQIALVSSPSPLHSTRTPDIPEDLVDGETPEEGHKLYYDLLSCIPTRLSLCCSDRCIRKRRSSMETLDVVTTGETYLTARDDQGRGRDRGWWGFSLEVPSMPNFG